VSGSFSPEQLERLSGMIETGANLSSGRLAQLSQTRWRVVSSSVRVLDGGVALPGLGTPDQPHIGVVLSSQSLLPLGVLLLMPAWSLEPLVEAVTRLASKRLRAHPARGETIIKETANILGQGVVQELANRLGISIVLSVPELSRGRGDELAAGFLRGKGADQTVVLAHVEMLSEGLLASCSLLLAIDTAGLRRLLAARP